LTHFFLQLEKDGENQNEYDGRRLGHRVERDGDVLEAPLGQPDVLLSTLKNPFSLSMMPQYSKKKCLSLASLSTFVFYLKIMPEEVLPIRVAF
jgi:hypothetical protein